MSIAAHLRTLSRPLVEYRAILSFGLSAACGVVLDSFYPIEHRNPFLQLVALQRPAIFHALLWSYNVFLYSTPFLVFSILFSLAYIHFYEPKPDLVAGALPHYPDPCHRTDLYIIAGEIHHPLKLEPSPAPRWLSIPERGLYTGICVFGAIGSGKTQAVVLPAMRQLFAYRANDPDRRLSGVVLEVKGDLCRQVQRILKSCGRSDDYVEVSLTGDVRYNPLNNDSDAYAQAFNIASVITAIWGKGKEPFWQQSYTDLVPLQRSRPQRTHRNSAMRCRRRLRQDAHAGLLPDHVECLHRSEGVHDNIQRHAHCAELLLQLFVHPGTGPLPTATKAWPSMSSVRTIVRAARL